MSKVHEACQSHEMFSERVGQHNFSRRVEGLAATGLLLHPLSHSIVCLLLPLSTHFKPPATLTVQLNVALAVTPAPQSSQSLFVWILLENTTRHVGKFFLFKMISSQSFVISHEVMQVTHPDLSTLGWCSGRTEC